jgi:hypothetical protein
VLDVISDLSGFARNGKLRSCRDVLSRAVPQVTVATETRSGSPNPAVSGAASAPVRPCPPLTAPDRSDHGKKVADLAFPVAFRAAFGHGPARAIAPAGDDLAGGLAAGDVAAVVGLTDATGLAATIVRVAAGLSAVPAAA